MNKIHVCYSLDKKAADTCKPPPVNPRKKLSETSKVIQSIDRKGLMKATAPQ